MLGPAPIAIVLAISLAGTSSATTGGASLGASGAASGTAADANSSLQKIASADRNLRAGEMRAADDRALAFYKKAASLAAEALKEEPHSAKANFLYFAARGRLLVAQGTVRNMVELVSLRTHLDRALELDPDYPDALAAKGTLAMELPGYLGGDKKLGQQLLRRAVNANPVGPATRLHFAKALVSNGDMTAARHELRLVSYYACRQRRYLAMREAETLLEEVRPGSVAADPGRRLATGPH